MKMNVKMRAILVCIVLLQGSSYAAAKDVIEVKVPWNPVAHPQTFGEVTDDCLRNNKCVGALDALGAAVGLPPGSISTAVRGFQGFGGRFSGHRQGEQYRIYSHAPAGFRICDVRVNMISAAPINKNRSPTFAATVQSDEIFELYSFVHRLQIGRGRSWVQAVATVRFVRRGSPQDVGCHVKSGAKYQYYCNQRRKDGHPYCGNVAFGTIRRTR
ncbi:hypothetical protein [uncultured Roseobacter sp.]|uniref:hypothetical protein n=1 Tax=uncultured Roseobacter sp. TaxID=114847 RepID=UPI0026068457|nr:hypothetical protein [uncultured Roseobacter sp.]